MTPKQSKLHKYILDNLKVSATEYQIQEIEKILRGKQRSVKQNNSVFGIAYKLTAEGMTELWQENVTVDYVHAFFKERFAHILTDEKYVIKPYDWKPLPNKDTGEIEYVMDKVTTTRLNTVGMMKYYEEIQQFGAVFLGINIPSPNERDFTDQEAR